MPRGVDGLLRPGKVAWLLTDLPRTAPHRQRHETGREWAHSYLAGVKDMLVIGTDIGQTIHKTDAITSNNRGYSDGLPADGRHNGTLADRQERRRKLPPTFTIKQKCHASCA
jgi:hypothetical protein